MLDLIWIANFKDGSVVKQFDVIEGQTGEHPFKEVLDKMDELDRFALVNVHSNVAYIVNLKNGTISATVGSSPALDPDEDMLNDDSRRYRLIYFRRVTREFGLDLKQIDDAKIVYFLGFQCNDKDGRNYKRLMKIDKDGKLIVN